MQQNTLGDTPNPPQSTNGDIPCFDSNNGSTETTTAPTKTRRRLVRPSSQIPKKRPLSQIKSCVAYIRVSTPGQADSGHGLAAQREAVEAEAKRRGWTLEAVYMDSGISGTKSDRAGLAEAVMHAKADRIPLVVPSLSRIGRRVKIIQDTLEELENAGCSFISCSECIDSSGACGKMIVNVMSGLAEMERDLVSERTKAALTTIREAGKKTGGKLAPFGWDALEDGTLVENEREQEALDFMFALKKEGFSLRRIGQELKRRGFLTKSGLTEWQAKVVRSCLHVVTQLKEAKP